MKLEERIEELANKYDLNKFREIWWTSKKIIEDIKNHTKQITAQLSEFDIHDEKHSEEVIRIIERLLGEKIDKLSFYELLLIYMSSYIHDAAMALPSWEYTLLREVEGTDEFYDNTLKIKIRNDFKPVHKYIDAIDIVNNNKEILYSSFENIKTYIFIESNENELMNSLADLMCDYEEFRNGYVEDLERYKKSPSDYINYSKIIRSEYIRSTHHIRIESYIKRIKQKYICYIGSLEAEKFVNDLGLICRSHGEEIEYVFNLDNKRKINNYLTANIQFVSILLRLGDVIHFSADRAPMSLFAEKNITDETSMMHWKSKFQELKYSFCNNNGHTYIKYSAYCSLPSTYYFIQKYIDCIDDEISNYYNLKHKWEYDNLDDIENYAIDIGNKVDRSDVNSDKSIFIPNNNMKFRLNQSKVLELLMGIQLYKDKYLCLREIYQNALDATKCMIAHNESNFRKEELFIEFGLGEDIINGNRYKYIYCLDKGIGMNKYIIDNYLLNIGNSYYKSKDFRKNNVGWNQGVKATSQFGIGLLSGYMLADKIGITTRYHESGSELISFILEGVNEYSYYVNPNRIDDEKIGSHGTMIKLYLKSEIAERVNNNKISKLPLLLMIKNDRVIKEFIDIDEYKNNLMFLISRNIGIENKDMPIYIVNSSGERERLISRYSIFNFKKYPQIKDEDVKKLYQEYYFFDGSSNQYNEMIDKREYIKDYIIEINTESLQVYSHISFPKKNINSDNLKIYDFSKFIGNNEGEILVDGVFVGGNKSLNDNQKEILGNDVIQNSIFNFNGEKRPILSVDRNSIISMPDIYDEIETIKQEYINKIASLVLEHIRNNDININDKEMSLILDIITRRFPTIVGSILKILSSKELSQVSIAKEVWDDTGIKLNDLFNCRNIEIRDCDFRRYKEVNRQLILRKAMSAEKIEVNDDNIKITSNEFIEFALSRHYHSNKNISLSSVAIAADEWSGKFSEYDLVSNIWPIISSNLYMCLNCEYEVTDVVEGRSKRISDSGNAIQAIAQLDPAMINPRVGIAIKESSFKEKESYIGEFDKIIKSFWLFELNNHGEDIRDKKRDYALFVYISPRSLNDKEKIRLREYELEDAKYVKGVREGWSILFLGKMQKYVILPGLCTRKEIIEAIPYSYIEEVSDVTYYNTDGTKVFQN
ncbi:MAG: hypothetical protein ACLRU3_02160 [Paraclostridium sp.]